MRLPLLTGVLLGWAYTANALDPSVPLLRAIEQESWHIAIKESGKESALKSYVLWRALQDDKYDAGFGQIAAFIDAHPNWPDLNRLRMRAEKVLFQERNRSAQAEQWLKRNPPLSGYGMLAQARISPNKLLIRDAWIQGDFERQDETQILKEFSSALDATAHRARAEHLLQDGKASIAERLLSFVGDDYATLYRARIALQRDEHSLNAKIDRIPSKLKGDHGLLADRLLWRHKKGHGDGVRELLLAMRPDSPYAENLWRIRASHARDAIEAKAYNDAAALLKNAGKLEVASNADYLWLIGWLELTFRKNASSAYQHFTNLFASVNYPVSKSRGAYWSARAAQQLGDKNNMNKWLHVAASYPTVFYGQLAQQAIHPSTPLKLPGEPAVDSSAYQRYQRDPLMQLAIGFHRAGLERFGLPLVHHLASQAKTAGEYAALLKLCQDNNMTHAQVRVSKLALQENIILRGGWPIIMPPEDSPLVAELALAISRQESEFNPRAVSSANARGLMQLLPSTGKRTASKLGKSYSLDKLFDPVYNMRLGSQYLYDLIEGFDGNYILAIAGYNAGPGRSRQWVERFGWPGKDFEKTLTFLELIPFSETRNYVQRVLENKVMYQALRTPNQPIDLQKDLLR